MFNINLFDHRVHRSYNLHCNDFLLLLRDIDLHCDIHLLVLRDDHLLSVAQVQEESTLVITAW